MGTPNRPVMGILDTPAIRFDPGGIGARRAPTRTSPCADLLVAMRPGTFLALATPLPVPRPSLAWIALQLAAGRPVCPPMLRVWLPPRRGGTPAVVAHDGRHRALALRAIAGDALIPVQIELPTFDPNEEAPGWALAAMRGGMRTQGGARRLVPGPLFEAATDPAWIGAPSPARPRRARGPPQKRAAGHRVASPTVTTTPGLGPVQNSETNTAAHMSAGSAATKARSSRIRSARCAIAPVCRASKAPGAPNTSSRNASTSARLISAA